MLLIVSLGTHSSERLVSKFPFDVVTNLKNNLAMSMPEIRYRNEVICVSSKTYMKDIIMEMEFLIE